MIGKYMSWIIAPFRWLGTTTGAVAREVASYLPSKKPRKYRYVGVEDFPEKPLPFDVYVAGEGVNLWAVQLICPCGCKEIIELNLLQQTRPCWSVSKHQDGTISLHPSVWRRKGCKSHFIMRHGSVRWCD